MAGDDFLRSSKDGDDAEKKKKRLEDSGLGNLPPLSNFDSSGFESDAGLPPLSSFESDGGASAGGRKSLGGLPPVSDINIETPQPAGGNIKAPPAGFDPNEIGAGQGRERTFGGLSGKVRTGFQDLAADSDFSPETPDIGPGPDSEIDTPMFDSAFGSADSGAFAQPFDTVEPAKAQHPPMFGGEDAQPAGAERISFDAGAFDASDDFVAAGAPGFSPDTATPMTASPPGAPPQIGKLKKAKAKGVGGASSSRLATAAIALVALAIGIVLGPILSNSLTFIPNPLRAVVADNKVEIDKLNLEIKKYREISTDSGKPIVTKEELDKMLDQKKGLTNEIAGLTTQKTDAQAKLDETSAQFDKAKSDLDSTTKEYVEAQGAFEDLQNKTAITQARQMGLVAEVDRLTGLVGTLDEANTRSQATKEALEHSIDLLTIRVKEGIPLTPAKYSRDARRAAVENLKAQAEAAKWVTPALQDAYTAVYQKELDIAASTEYFFARMPVTNKLGEVELKWAECLMKGNWAVYYRSLDGKNIGIYENLANSGSVPSYGPRENLPKNVQEEIAAQVMASRVKGFEAKLQALAEKEQIANGLETPMQKVFDSL